MSGKNRKNKSATAITEKKKSDGETNLVDTVQNARVIVNTLIRSPKGGYRFQKKKVFRGE